MAIRTTAAKRPSESAYFTRPFVQFIQAILRRALGVYRLPSAKQHVTDSATRSVGGNKFRPAVKAPGYTGREAAKGSYVHYQTTSQDWELSEYWDASAAVQVEAVLVFLSFVPFPAFKLPGLGSREKFSGRQVSLTIGREDSNPPFSYFSS